VADLTLDLIQEIDGFGWTFDAVRRQLQGFDGDNVIVPINSFGGDVFEGLSIYNLLKKQKYKVRAEILTYAMSIGTIIALAADRVVMPENGFFMIHNPFAFAAGDGEDLENTAALLEKITVQMAKIYSEKTGLTTNKIRKMLKAETWLTAKEAKALGFVDEVVKPVKMAANFKREQFAKFENVPEEIQAQFKPLTAPKATKQPTTPATTPTPDNSQKLIEMDYATIKAEVKRIFGFEGDDVSDKLKDEKTLPEIKAALKEELKPVIKAELLAEVAEEIKAEVKAGKDALQGQIDGFKAQLAQAKTDFDTYKADAEGKITALQASNKKLGEDMATMKAENETLKNEKTQLEAKVAELSGGTNPAPAGGGGVPQTRASQAAFTKRVRGVSNKAQYSD